MRSTAWVAIRAVRERQRWPGISERPRSGRGTPCQGVELPVTADRSPPGGPPVLVRRDSRHSALGEPLEGLVDPRLGYERSSPTTYRRCGLRPCGGVFAESLGGGHCTALGLVRHTAVNFLAERATLPQGWRAPRIEARRPAREREAAIRGRIAERTPCRQHAPHGN